MALPAKSHSTIRSRYNGLRLINKSADSNKARPLIETAFERVYGTAYRLRCIVKPEGDGGTNLLDDPVINYAARTFGGQPKRVATEEPPV